MHMDHSKYWWAFKDIICKLRIVIVDFPSNGPSLLVGLRNGKGSLKFKSRTQYTTELRHHQNRSRCLI